MNPFELALEMERKSAAFYEAQAKTAAHHLVRELFTMLAADERQHEAAFAGIVLEQGTPNPPDLGGSAEQRMREIFGRLSGRIQPGVGKAEGLQAALEMERDSYDLYRGEAVKAADPALNRFYHAIMEQELQHFEAIENVLAYLTDPGDWFMDDESKRWNWMNT